MSSKRYTEEFKKEAVKQITDRGYSVVDVAQRPGTTTHSLYAWLKAELRRMAEERDILKKAANYFASQSE